MYSNDIHSTPVCEWRFWVNEFRLFSVSAALPFDGNLQMTPERADRAIHEGMHLVVERDSRTPNGLPAVS